MNARERRKAIAAMFEVYEDHEVVAALEWVENDMPLYFGTDGVRYALANAEGHP